MRLPRLLRNSLTSTLILLLLSACDTKTVYHSYRHISKDGWSKSDTLVFNTLLTDTLNAYQFTVEVRNSGNYPYQDLYLFIRSNPTDSCLFTTDTIKCTLANEQGQWTGYGLGAMFQNAFPARPIPFRHRKDITFKINHGMTDPLLNGIDDIGIRITKK